MCFTTERRGEKQQMKKEENLKTSRQKHSYLENEYIENVAKQRKFTNKK